MLEGKEDEVLGIRNYFEEGVRYSKWMKHKKAIKIPKYHKTYESITKTIIRGGFEIIDYRDCYPIAMAKKLFPKQYQFYTKVPIFCVWKLRKK